MTEEWRTIEEAPRYEVSNLGLIRNKKTQRILKGSYDKDGYKKVTLTLPHGKTLTRFIHRLVGIAFLPNPNNYPVINHKDEIKDHNRVDNLEWCSFKYNCNYSDRKRGDGFGIPIYVYHKDTHELIGKFPTIASACRSLNLNPHAVYPMCSGSSLKKHHHGFIFSKVPLE